MDLGTQTHLPQGEGRAGRTPIGVADLAEGNSPFGVLPDYLKEAGT